MIVSAGLFATVAPVAWAFGSAGAWASRVAQGLGAVFVADLALVLSARIRNGAGSERPVGLLVADALAAASLPVWGAGLPILGSVFGLAKLARLGAAMRRWRVRTLRYASPLPLLFAVFWLLLAVHWICSGWIVLRDTDPSLGLAAKYVDSLYWTVTTLTAVGYGDITPTSLPQKLFAIGTMVVGLAFLGYMIGVIANMLGRRDPSRVRFLANVEQLSVAAQYGKIPQDLQRRVYDYYAYIWRERPGYDELEFLRSLPPGLRAEVSRHMKGDVLEQVPLFRDADPHLVGQVALRLEPEVLTPGDFVFCEGDLGQCMYFVARGELEVLKTDQPQPIARLGDGDFFGEIALFENETRTASVRAVTYCDVYCLAKSAFDEVFRGFPETVAAIRTEALSRQQKDATRY